MGLLDFESSKQQQVSLFFPAQTTEVCLSASSDLDVQRLPSDSLLPHSWKLNSVLLQWAFLSFWPRF